MNYRERRIAWLCICMAICVLLAMRMQLKMGLRTGIWLLAVYGLLAYLPVAPWPRRFSIRDLFIATTLVALVLGLIVWGVRG